MIEFRSDARLRDTKLVLKRLPLHVTAPVTQCNNSSVACQGQFPDISYMLLKAVSNLFTTI